MIHACQDWPQPFSINEYHIHPPDEIAVHVCASGVYPTINTSGRDPIDNQT